MSATPAWPGYLADPFVQRMTGGYLAIGTEDPAPEAGDLFPLLFSPDLREWRAAGRALPRPVPELGDAFWAPEIVERDGSWWLYYSAGRGIDGHRIRVARATTASGPYDDLGIELTPHDTFAIDAHPFRDDDGSWYLYFARDVLDAERVGTHLAVARMASPVELADEPVSALEPFADWQLYERARRMYGRTFDWHTLEGPSVVRRHGRYWMTFSGGAWTGEGYRVSWAVADHPLGPWTPAPADAPPLLASGHGLVGPGHNSLTVGPDGSDVIVFHSWDARRTARRMHLARISFEPDGPRVTDPPGDRP